MPDVGALAPGFVLTSQHGQAVEPIGHRACLLVFFPFAFTGICAGELAALRQAHDRFVDRDVDVFAISCDSIYALRRFADADHLAFDLLSDFWPHGEVSRAYGCLDESTGGPLRHSFGIDAAGVVRWSVQHGAGEPRPIELHLSALDALG